MNTHPTIVIGDVHGLTFWEKVVEENPEGRYIFLGDYLDPYENMSTCHLINNLKKIINLKKERKDDVILLLGNHDIHYLNFEIKPCWRFDETIKDAAHTLFSENIHLFMYAFQEGNRLFTHAGISQRWFLEDFKGDIEKNIAKQINNPKHDQISALDSGEGFFWVRKYELIDPLPGYTQFVGHTRVDKIIKHTANNGEVTYCDCLYNEKYLILDH